MRKTNKGWLIMDNLYIPQKGDSIGARRKVKSQTLPYLIVGPVVDVWDNACRVVTNEGTDYEGDFKLYFNEWNFQFLHKTDGLF